MLTTMAAAYCCVTVTVREARQVRVRTESGAAGDEAGSVSPSHKLHMSSWSTVIALILIITLCIRNLATESL